MMFPTRKEWSQQSNCKTNPEPFMEDRPNVDECRAICDACPVRTLCLAHALVNNERGFWGGYTYRQRQRMSTKDLGIDYREVPTEWIPSDYLRKESAELQFLQEKAQQARVESQRKLSESKWARKVQDTTALSHALSDLLLVLPKIS